MKSLLFSTMKTRLIVSVILTLSPALCTLSNLEAQVPQGFNYQAIARDASGNPIQNATLKVKLSILSDTTGFYGGTGGTYIWEEEHSNVKTNSFGMFTVVLGSPAAVKVQGTAPTFSSVNWSVANLYVGTKIAQAPGYVYKVMGSAKLWSVPYSMMANDISGALKKLTVTGETSNMEEALFEVKNKNGQTVFAVYNEGVRVYVDDGSKGLKGGFAIGSFGSDKGPLSDPLFVVNADSIRAYIKQNPVKGVKGGFAIGSFDPTKAYNYEEYLQVTRDSTRVYVRESGKGLKGGFAIGGFDAVKGITTTNFVNLNSSNYLIGQEAGKNISTGLYNNFIGYQAGYLTTTGGYNTFIGYQAGKENLDGNSNIFIGHQAGEKNSSGTGNVFMGIGAGQDFQTGYNNTFIGTLAGQNFTNGSSNIFIGRSAGAGYSFPVGATGGTNNIMIGNYSAYHLTTGLNNVIIGNLSGFYNTSGYENLFAGNQSGYANNNGYENISLGSYSGYNNNEGYQNVFIGVRAGFNNQSGKKNTFIGTGSGYDNVTGDGNIFIGFGSGASLISPSNRLIIENSSVGETGALIYGEFDNDYLRLNANTDIFGRLGVGKASASARVDIAATNWDVLNTEGDFRIGDANYRFKIGVATAGGGAGDVRLTAHGGTNRLILGGGGKEVIAVTNANLIPWTDNFSTLGASTNRWTTIYATNGVINTSDARLKSNIRAIDYGLESIMQLTPVSFSWKDDKNGTRMLGLIAQDVEKVIGEVVDHGNNPDQPLGLNYTELIPVLIKGIQEQQKLLEQALSNNAELKTELQSLRDELEQIKASLGFK